MVDTNYNLPPKTIYGTDGGNTPQSVDKKGTDAVRTGIQGGSVELPPAQKEAILRILSNLVPNDPDTSKDLGGTRASFERAAKTMGTDGAQEIYIGDIAHFLAKAMIEAAGQQRQNALDDRLAARQEARAQLLKQSGKMKDAAEKMMDGATTALIMGVVGGAISIAGSMTAALGTLSQVKKMSQSMKSTKDAVSEVSTAERRVVELEQGAGNLSRTERRTAMIDAKTARTTAVNKQEIEKKAFETASAKSQMFTAAGQVGSAFGDTTRSIGTSLDARAQAEAKKTDAEGTKDAAEAQYIQQTADTKKELQDSLNDMIKQIIDFLKEIENAKVEGMRAFTRV